MSRYQLAINRIIANTSRFELVYCTHPYWPHFHLNQGETTGNEPLNVTILDSSFNPPTIAHAALASASRVEPALAHLVASPRLLLLSLTNPDKILKAGDATPAQRLEMMAILADELATGANAGSIAVGVTNAPTFVEKSVILREQFETSLGKSTRQLKSDYSIGTEY